MVTRILNCFGMQKVGLKVMMESSKRTSSLSESGMVEADMDLL